MDGWIKLHRKLLEWEWFDTSNMVHLFLFFLLKANYEDTKWHGIEIKKGQLITSLQSIKKSTGLSLRAIRTCISRLKTTSELTSKTTNKYTIITVCNYESYQILENINDKQNDKQNDKRTTNKRQTNDKQTTTDKNIKNIRSKEEEEVNKPEISKPEISLYKNFVDIYFNFYESLNNIKPKFTAVDGKAIKELIIYFTKIAKDKLGDKFQDSDVEKGFKYLLSKYNCWSDFNKKQIKLIQINANINNLINDIKYGNTKLSIAEQFQRDFGKK